jgi:xanthine dehydrogenase YagR molybdenum-binding subunit
LKPQRWRSDIVELAHGEPRSPFGAPQRRIDGRAKVTGHALFPSDEPIQAPAHAFLLTSAIARGRILSFDTVDARSLEGVRDIFTFENIGHEVKPPEQMSGGGTTTTLQDEKIWHDGQIIGVVVADTFEIAREAAFRVGVHYDREAPSATFGSAGVSENVRKAGEHKDCDVGDAEAALAVAEVGVDSWYSTPTQHHNPIELFTTTCAWTMASSPFGNPASSSTDCAAMSPSSWA